MVLKPERFTTWITPEFHVTPLEFHGIPRNSHGIPRKFFQTVFHKRGHFTHLFVWQGDPQEMPLPNSFFQ